MSISLGSEKTLSNLSTSVDGLGSFSGDYAIVGSHVPFASPYRYESEVLSIGEPMSENTVYTIDDTTTAATEYKRFYIRLTSSTIMMLVARAIA